MNKFIFEGKMPSKETLAKIRMHKSHGPVHRRTPEEIEAQKRRHEELTKRLSEDLKKSREKNKDKTLPKSTQTGTYKKYGMGQREATKEEKEALRKAAKGGKLFKGRAMSLF